METITVMLQRIDKIVWGPAMLALMMGTGAYLMLRMRFLPLRRFGYALCCLFQKEESGESKTSEKVQTQGEISALSSLTTELAATIGTGNIVGVATAMVLGGPGALVWMLLSALLGFPVKFAESMLSVKYRTRNEAGQTVGGPMYTLKAAFPFRRTGKLLAVLYAVFAVLASFGMGNMAQSNSITQSLWEVFAIPQETSGMVLSICVILVVLGGIRQLAKLTLYLVPGMALFYIVGTLAVIWGNREQLLPGILQILQMAVHPQAAVGGVGGMLALTMQDAMRVGVARGVFSNEAGLGAAGISAAAAETASPVRQGYISMTGVFFDTIIICTLTGLAIASSGVLGMTDREGELLSGAALTIAAFSTTLGKGGSCFVALGITLFAFATIIAWEYQGERAFEFLVRKHSLCIWYRFCYALITFVGAVCALEAVWSFSDIMNAMMAVPNLLCVLALGGEVCLIQRQEDAVRKN